MLNNKELFDVYSIQGKSEEILYALENVSSDDEVVLYTGLDSEFKIGGYVIPQQFKNAIFVNLHNKYLLNNGIQKHGKLIKVMDGSTFSEDTFVSDNLAFLRSDILDVEIIEKILKVKKIDFKKCCSDYIINKKQNHSVILPEIWFGRDIDIFFDAIDGQVNKDIILYNNLKAEFTLSIAKNGQREQLYYRQYPFALQLDDKFLLISIPTDKEQKLSRVDNSYLIRGGGMAPNGLGYYPIGNKYNFIKSKLEDLGFTTIETDEMPPFVLNNRKIK